MSRPPRRRRMPFSPQCIVGLYTALAVWVSIGPTLAQEAAAEICWTDVSQELGIDFKHQHFGFGEKYMPENMGSGVAVFDANGDGRLDLYFLQGAPWKALAQGTQTPVNQLWLQRRDGTFENATEGSGLGHPGYAMGVTVGDVNGDGHADVYVTNEGPDVLLRGDGKGRFTDLTEASGLGLDGWSTGAAFLDLEGDGDLDLFVSRYVTWDRASNKWCGNARRQLRSYCHPDVYDGASDRLYRNRGDGTFEDISGAAGLRPPTKAKGLGVLTYDLDGDGHQDVYVANDSTMNFFYRGTGEGKVKEEALLNGLGFNGAGAAEASMGIAFGDVDGRVGGELLLTHLDQESNTLYRGQNGLYEDISRKSGIERLSMPWVGFGVEMLDVEHDGDLDVLVTNGHILDNIQLFDAARTYRQPLQWLRGNGAGRFGDASLRLGIDTPLVGRGLALGDLDDDGDLDAVITQNGDRALVLRNDCAPPASSLKLRLRGTPGDSPEGSLMNLDALGSRVELRKGDRVVQTRYLVGGGSYLSHSDRTVHFGVGTDTSWTLHIHWPDGATRQVPDAQPGFTYTVTRGQKDVEKTAFRSSGSAKAPKD